MSREVRRVPPHWVHPKGRALHDGAGLRHSIEDWEQGLEAWLGGRSSWSDKAHDRPCTEAAYIDCEGARPDPADYMPVWSDAERTHLQMYETTTEGTPISPVMATAEELAQWLVVHNASAFANHTATYEQWFAMIQAGSSIGSAVTHGGQLISGVAAVKS